MAKSTAGTIIASVLITLAITGAGAFFGLPYLYPNIRNIPTRNAGDVIQVQKAEFQNYCFCNDDEVTQKEMNGTRMTIDTTGDSYIMVGFSTLFMLGVGSGFIATDYISFNITMVILGVGNYSTFLEFGHVEPDQWFTIPFSWKVNTPTISEGTYEITMYWHSRHDASGANYLSANHNSPTFKYNIRSLVVQEIAA
jgi:hypothetical protein